MADITDNVEKSRFYLSANAPQFYTSFFLALLEEYEKIVRAREGEVVSQYPAAQSLIDRMYRSMQELREEVDLFRGLGHRL